ncbi:MAG: SPOR domain-containing protein [Aquabacterium sp.]|nr:SPOR domain-containing protein [Aquabacterium sp.]
MGLLSYFKRNTDAATEASAPAAPDAVAAARTRARRRLIGAAVLLGVGVIGFPLLFETQPRPIPVNIPIEIPRKDGAPPLVLPHATPALSPASAAVVAADAAPPAPAPAEITERAGEQGREVPPVTAAPAAAKAASARPAASAAVAAKPPPAASKPAPARTDDDGARARALLDGPAAAQPASAAGARMVVQVGAFTEPAKLQEARRKVEAMGFKTYTQVVEVDGAKRTRVRVGPFANRGEADKAAARIKAGGLPAAILTL